VENIKEWLKGALSIVTVLGFFTAPVWVSSLFDNQDVSASDNSETSASPGSDNSSVPTTINDSIDSLNEEQADSSESISGVESTDSSCNENYDPCVESSSYDLDCDDIGQEVEVTGSDEYGLDRDGDGYGCESY
jgi:hypothetical protein